LTPAIGPRILPVMIRGECPDTGRDGGLASQPRLLRRRIVPTVALLALGMMLAACGSKAAVVGGVSTSISVTSQKCAPQWSGPQTTGAKSFSVTNSTSLTEDVQLLNPDVDRVYGEILTLGPGTTRPLTVTLGPGKYSWQCASVDNVVISSSLEPVRGPKVASSPSYVPTTPDILAPSVAAYQQTITSGLGVLATDTDALLVDVRTGNVAAAKAAWLTTHLDYERLGAAYDTFGGYDDLINGRANGLVGGVDNPSWSGFRRLEYALWHGQPQTELLTITGKLDTDVHRLQRAFPHQLFLNTDVALRAHEILENALQFELTGETDEGSHTNLATVWANAQGTQSVLNALQPLLQVRNPSLFSSAETQLGAFTSLVHSFDRGGSWTPVESLTITEHEQIDASIDGLLEQLAMIPGTLREYVVGAD
jgi:high-affinity iron transporter